MATILNTAPITSKTIDGVEYHTTTRGGVEYCAYFQKTVGKWWVGSRRLALGRFNAGTGKYYDRIEDCKAFAALPALLSMKAAQHAA